MEDLLASWADLLEWFSQAGLSSQGVLKLPETRGAEALNKVIQLRTEWGRALEKLVRQDEVDAAFYARLNEILAKDLFHDVLRRDDKKKFRLVRSDSLLKARIWLWLFWPVRSHFSWRKRTCITFIAAPILPRASSIFTTRRKITGASGVVSPLAAIDIKWPSFVSAARRSAKFGFARPFLRPQEEAMMPRASGV